ncbi:MAG: YeeE/YedE family protein [Rhodobacteraceae bacterium]|nr:YeeE/YedE family protein [Paracoccaceae bacterium]
MDESLLAALVGLAGGTVLGLAARLGDFCTFGAIESAYLGRDQSRLRLWGIVLGVAIISVFLLDTLGQIDISSTIYHQFQWNPVASILGGLVFGYGMSMSGNCGFGALARFGGGDLRSMVVVIVIAISGFFTLSGPLAQWRVMVFPPIQASTEQGFAHLLSHSLGITPMIIAAVVAALLVGWALSYRQLRERPVSLFWGIAAGLAIASAFWGTYALNLASFDQIRVQGHTFTAPLGRALLFLMTSSGGGLGFPVGSVTGVLLGAFIGSSIKGQFRWEACEDPRELGRQVAGACLMGVGGVLAMGCSIGQGVTAFSTLAYSGPVTLAAIICGAVLGLRHLLSGFAPE